MSRRAVPILALLLAVLGAAPALSAQMRWDNWWQNQEDEFLWGDEPWSVQHEARAAFGANLGDPADAAPTTAGGARDGLGAARTPRSAPPDHDDEHTLRRGFVYAHVVPVLLELAEHGEDPRLRAQAVRALGRVVEPRFASLISDTLLTCLGDDSTRVRAQAALAMGLVYDPERGAELVAVAADAPEGRRIVLGERVRDSVRRGAMLGLGYAGDARLVPALLRLLEKLPAGNVSLRRTAITALGLAGGPRAPQIADALHELLTDPFAETLERADAATALGRLGVRDSLPVLLETLDARHVDPRLQQSCLAALGEAADAGDAHVVERLLEVAVEDSDPDSRRYAWLAAARLLARDRVTVEHVGPHVEFVKTLEAQLEHPRHRADRAFHALAAGIYLRPHRTQAPGMLALLEEQVVDLKDPDLRGAYALALGLGAHESSGELLHELFLDNKEQLFRAECALALGFVRAEAAGADLRAVLQERGVHPRLIELAGTASMLLDDEAAAPLILARLLDSGSFYERRGLVAALAHFRSEAVARQVVTHVQDERLDMITRVDLCNALGRLATRRALPTPIDYSIMRNLTSRDRKLDALLGTPLDERGALEPELEQADEEDSEEEESAEDEGG